MATLEAERVGDVLWIRGNVDRTMEKDLGQILDKYVKEVLPAKRVIEMSGVPYFASSIAKILIGVAQDTEAKGTKLKVRSSPPVLQTLNLLGAKSWIDIETCPRPNAKPQAAPPPAPEPVSADKKSSSSNVTPAKPASDPSISSITSVGIKRAGLGGLHGIMGQGSMDASMAAAAERSGGPLVEDDADIPEGYGVLRELLVLGTYTFHIIGVQQDITGRVLDHISGPWILVETRGTRRMINLEQVGCIDVLNM